MLQWTRTKLHPSWLIAWLSIATVSGIALGSLTGPVLAGVAWPIASAAALLLTFIKPVRYMVVVALVSGVMLGMWRGGNEQSGLARYIAFYGNIVTVQGTVSDDAAYGPHGDQRLMLRDIRLEGQSLNGQIWASTVGARTIKRSDRVLLRGKLLQGFGSASASMFEARVMHVTQPQPGDIGLAVRDLFAGGIRAAIPEPEASLASGYLLGQRSALPADLDSQLKTVGLTHAVVASGYNLTILVSVARQLLLGVSKYLATLSAASMIVGFIMISGASPSMSRAGLVTSLSLAAWYYGRRIHPLTLLPLAAAITALLNPLYVWGDIGWYLSFTSFAGVIIIAPLIRHALWRNKEQPGIILQIIIDTMAAQLATLPIMVFAFGHYSPYALLANVLVLPLIPLTMLLTFIAGVIGLILPGAAHAAGMPANLMLHYMTAVIARIADLPGSQGDLGIGTGALAASYMLLAVGAFVLWRITKWDFRAEYAKVS